MVLDESVSSKYIEKNPELVLVGVMEGEPKAAAFNKDDKELMENFSKVLEEMITDGTVAELREKYKI